jgi:predicted esterase
MEWTAFSGGHRLGPLAGDLPDAVVVLLHDLGEPTETLLSVAASWAETAPTTAFVAFDSLEQRHPPPAGGQWPTMLDVDADAEPGALNRIARHLTQMIAEQQRAWRLDDRQIVLVGFRQGATAALHVVLHHGWSCAGVLAFSPKLPQALPRIIPIGPKLRIIESVETSRVSYAKLRDIVASLAVRGIDARGVVLDGALLSAEAIRYGGAYLVGLIAAAQHRVDRGARDEQ